jgi:hypothetical protein
VSYRKANGNFSVVLLQTLLREEIQNTKQAAKFKLPQVCPLIIRDSQHLSPSAPAAILSRSPPHGTIFSFTKECLHTIVYISELHYPLMEVIKYFLDCNRDPENFQ